MPATEPLAPGPIAFRLEWGGPLGWGHLARCAALAAELRARGRRTLLWTDSSLDQVPADFRVFDQILPVRSDTVPEAAAVVVDHYATDDTALRSLRARTSARFLVIDDEARRTLDAADLILNSRLGLRQSPYASGVPALLGERYALLRPGLLHPLPPEPALPPAAIPVLITLGGTDHGAHTAHVLRALAALGEPRLLPLILKPGPPGPNADEARALAAFAHHVWLDSVDAAAFAGRATSARFAISAAGGTLYELALLRVPFLALIVADNQRAFAREVEARWRMPILDTAVSGLDRALSEAIATLRALPSTAPEAFRSVDAHGPARVVDALLGKSVLHLPSA